MHPLLTRQIGRYLGGSERHNLELQCFINAVEQAYRQYEEDAQLNDRALELVSQELNERNSSLRLELAEHSKTEAALIREKAEQAKLLEEVEQAHNQLQQSEKLALIGQLAAGVAHEINNPISYVHSNIESLQHYLDDLMRLLDAYIEASKHLPEPESTQLQTLNKEIEYEFLRNGICALMQESQEGIGRVRKIVQDLKDFSRVDSDEEWQWGDIHQGIESTLNIVNNEIKYRADVVREFGTLPQIECLPSQINQVFMNLLVNAAHAMSDKKRGTIWVRTGGNDTTIWVEVADNGCGIPEAIRNRIFDPFFTTKPVGKGTGLGLALSYGIIHKHDGLIEVSSEEGKGTSFRITLPVKHHHDDESDA